MSLLPAIPDNMPRRNGRFGPWLGRLLLRLLGWRVEGELPNVNKCMVAAAPHTSNWDFFLAMPALLALDVKASWMMKKEAFFWPMKGVLMSLGGIPTDRAAAGGVVTQMARAYRDSEQLWIGITPEGTRGKVDRWKTGFLRIAYEAQVPVVLAGWDFPNKVMRFGRVFYPTGDYEKDIAEIRAYYRDNFQGKNPELH